MRQDHQQRLVQVLTEPGPDGKPFGVCTGFAITQSRILTCAHQVRGANNLKVRFVAKRCEWIEVNQIWPPRPGAALDPHDSTSPAVVEDCDVAVLEIDPNAVQKVLGSKLEPMLGYSSPPDGAEWCSRGLLKAGARPGPAGRPIWEPEDFGGKLYRADAKGIMSLDVNVSPTNVADWQGGSGSPVFVADQLVAVVRSWSSAWGGKRLQATWTGLLWDIPEFCQAAGLQKEGQRLLEMREAVVRYLRDDGGDRLLSEMMAELLGVGDQEIGLLVRVLCSLNSAVLLQLINEIIGRLLGGKTRADLSRAIELAELLERVVDLLLPWSADPSLLSNLKASIEQRTPFGSVMPCASLSVSEVLMARLDEGEVNWGDWSKGILVGAHCVTKDPRVGFGVDPKDRTIQILADLGKSCGIDVASMTTTELERIAAPVNEALTSRAKPRFGKPSRRPYLLYFKTEDEAPARLLEKLLPIMRVCRYDPNRYASGEPEICAELNRFATLKARRDELQKQRKVSA